MNDISYKELINKIEIISEEQRKNTEMLNDIKNKLSYYTGAFRSVVVVSGLVIGIFGYVATNYQASKDENDRQLFKSVYAIDNRLTKLEVLNNEKFPHVDN